VARRSRNLKSWFDEVLSSWARRLRAACVSYDRGVKIWSFDRWVNDNNIPTSFEYGKAWWDYVELVRRFADYLDADEVSVIGHYHVDTPPPCEHLPMPAVAIDTSGVTFALRFDFGAFCGRYDLREWAVSIQRRSPYTGPLFGLIRETEDLRNSGLEGLAPDYLFGPYRDNPRQFTVLVRDEWDVAALMRILAHES
jgi:hypothetical protein